MIAKLTRSLYYILFFVTPFVMLPVTSELFEFNKMIVIYTVAATVGLLWGFSMIRARRLILPATPLNIPILLFLAALAASTVRSIDVHTSIFGYYGRFNGGVLSIIAYLVLFYAFIALEFGDKAQFAKKLLKISLWASALIILWGLPARLFGGDLTCLVFSGRFSLDCWSDQFKPSERMFSTLGQPNWFGAYLAIHFFIGLYFYLTQVFAKKITKSTFILSGYLFLNICAILFTRSRSSYIAVAIGLLVVAVFLLTRFKKEIGRSRKMLILPILLLVVAVAVCKTGEPTVDKFITISKIKNQISPLRQGFEGQAKIQIKNQNLPEPTSEGTESFAIRRIVWQGAWLLGLKYPLTGTGVETFAYSYYFTRLLSHNITSEWDFLYNKAHNEYLNYLATTGFIGVAAYLLMIGVVLYLFAASVRNRHEDGLLAACLMAAYISILITNFFGFSTTTINIFFYLLPSLLIVQKKLPRPSSSRQVSTRNSKFLTVALLLSYFYILLNIVNYVRADIYYATAKNHSRVLDYPKAYEYFKKALDLRGEHVYQDAASYNAANLAFLSSYGKEVDLTNRLIALAQALNEVAIKASPKNVLYYKTRAKNDYLFHGLDGQKKYLEDGVKAMDTALELSPTDPKLPYTRAIFFSLLEETATKESQIKLYRNRSLHDLDLAIALKEDFRDAYFLQGQLLKKYDRPQEARVVFEFILKEIAPGDEEVRAELAQ